MTRHEVLEIRYYRAFSFFTGVFLFFAAIFLCSSTTAQGQGLVVTYGAKGVQTLTYNGTKLEDVGIFSADAFHIAHLQCTDQQGNIIGDSRCTWGETNLGELWNSATQTETYDFSWGSIATQFVQDGDNLNIIVTEMNLPGSGVILSGAEIHAIALHFPRDPLNFSGYNQYAITTTGPAVIAADYGSGVVTSVIPDESHPLYGGWGSLGNMTYNPGVSSIAPDNLATFFPHVSSPVQPGSSFRFEVSLRFTPEGTAANAQDAYTSFAETYPSQMTWTDKRIIGTAYLASSPSGNEDQPGGFPTNPRRYFNDASLDITSPEGLQVFQDRVLAQAASNVSNARAMNAQGVITWDIEGEEYPQTTSYVCSPNQIATIAPEMESIITNSSSRYLGSKLDDAYFATMTGAGLKVGVCLRPQVFTMAENGTASQEFLTTNANIIANLENKAKYANSRWGVTIFYVDSTVDAIGTTLDPAIFEQLITDLPHFLFVPEESTPRYYAYTAPFYTFIFHTDLGTPTSIYNAYPKAFGANLVNDVAAATLAQYRPQLTQSVERGDILMGHADYWQTNDPTLMQIYADAAAKDTRTTPAITWPAPAAISYGTALSATQLNATSNVPGTFVYFPAAGKVLNAGTNTLSVTFTPTDTINYKVASSSASLKINQATPVIRWTTPAAITQGTALSATQLDATTNVPGTFVYAPAAGAVLDVGSHTLKVTFTPADTTNYKVATFLTNLSVTQVDDVVLTWPVPAAISYGTALSGAQLNATSNVPGTFTYTPATGTVLNAGSHALNVTFKPTNTVNYKVTTSSVSLSVGRATPMIRWPAPASITQGTALSATQLNATANVPGKFVYTPSSGAVLNSGTTALYATFTPSDTTDYVSQTASVSLTVNSSSANGVAIVSPAAGASVSGTITVTGQITVSLDSAGSYLMVDGSEIGTSRVTASPFVYPLDTTKLSNGQHVLQLWAHDIGNNTRLSPAVTITVAK